MPTADPSTAAREAWHALQRHRDRLAERSIAAMFDDDPKRVERFQRTACGLHLDFSKQRLDAPALDALLALAAALDVAGWRERMFDGEPINVTEGRAALHVALRRPVDAPTDRPVLRDAQRHVHAVRSRMAAFADAVRDGQLRGSDGRAFTDVVNIGIGGSDLGPAMVCDALRDARAGESRSIGAHFISNLDATELNRVLERLDPASTLFIVASKSFTTRETLINAETARDWLTARLDDRGAVARHFAAVSANVERTGDFGIAPERVFGFWDWVGGRYSVWSAVGLSVACALGNEVFGALLDGAHEMDQHFLSAQADANLPLLLAMVGVWNRNLQAIPSHAVLPYDYALGLLPAYLQQLEMESLGKRVDRDGQPLAGHSVPVVWGSLGSNAQHAYYQMLHQGTQAVSADIIVAAHGQRPAPGHDEAVVANALAQAEAFMRGRSGDEIRAELANEGVSGDALSRAVAHRVMPGNRPNTLLLYERLSPRILGALIALYEHKVFVQSVCWGVNAFDQFGVELGKRLAEGIESALVRGAPADAHDPSTRSLLERIRRMRG